MKIPEIDWFTFAVLLILFILLILAIVWAIVVIVYLSPKGDE